LTVLSFKLSFTDQYWDEIPQSLPGRLNHEKKSRMSTAQTDIFDVVGKQSMRKRKTFFENPKDETDVEAAKSPEVTAVDSNEIDVSRIPRATVISLVYQNKPDVDNKSESRRSSDSKQN
jgi:hypothetical protein